VQSVEDVLRPASPEEAIRFFGEAPDCSVYVAGGTILSPPADSSVTRLVDLTGAGLSGVREEAGGLVIGATTTMASLVRDRAVAGYVGGMLASTASAVGTHTVRRRATLGGNIAGWPYPTDMPATLTALTAEVLLLSAEGARTAKCAEFYEGDHPALERGDLIVGVLFPRPLPGLSGGFARIGRPRPACPAVNAAAVARVVDGVLSDVRLATNVLSPVPTRLVDIEAVLQGEAPLAEVFGEAARRSGRLARDAGAAPERAEALAAAVLRAVTTAAGKEEA